MVGNGLLSLTQLPRNIRCCQRGILLNYSDNVIDWRWRPERGSKVETTWFKFFKPSSVRSIRNLLEFEQNTEKDPIDKEYFIL